MNNNTDKFETWAIVELMGHSKIAGKVSETTIGGCSFIRVDVPEIEGQAAFTKFYGNSAIYSMTPCSEELARLAVQRIQATPFTIYMPELHQLPAPDDSDDNFFDEEEEAYRSYYDGDYQIADVGLATNHNHDE